jgi:hypothetical protein
MESEGIHRVRVSGTKFTAIIILAIMAALLAEWPALRWLMLASVSVGALVGGGLILMRRRSRGAPPAARLNFPPPERWSWPLHSGEGLPRQRDRLFTRALVGVDLQECVAFEHVQGLQGGRTRRDVPRAISSPGASGGRCSLRRAKSVSFDITRVLYRKIQILAIN